MGITTDLQTYESEQHTAKMKLSGLIFLTCGVFCIRAQDPCDPNLNACRNDDPITTINCDGTECVGWPAESEDPMTITAEVCREKCEENAASKEDGKCEFYRWEQGHMATQTNCSLLEACEGPDPYCDGAQCITGQIGCTEQGQRITPCKLTAKTEWNKDLFHIICTDPIQGGLGDINIYNDGIKDINIPDGTVCSTIRRCAAWNETDSAAPDTTSTIPPTSGSTTSEKHDDPFVYNNPETYIHKLAITCNGLDGAAGQGYWEAMEITGNQALSGGMIGPDGTTIVEPECTSACQPLLLTEYATDDWADLICDTPLPDDDRLVEPNSCILLCDNHLKMSIDCVLTGEGEREWQNGDGQPILADADVKC